MLNSCHRDNSFRAGRAKSLTNGRLFMGKRHTGILDYLNWYVLNQGFIFLKPLILSLLKLTTMKGARNVFLLVLAALLLIVFVWGCNGYNGLVTGEQNVKKSWSNVETNYQRRTDLYSSVIKTVEASASFERSTLNDVIEARSKATSVTVNIDDPKSLQAFQDAQNNLQGSFGRLIATFERYPDLKTTQAFRDFQTQIEGTENRINVARQDYNKSVEGYNLKVKRFPGNMLASMFGFKEKGYYEADKGSEKVPEIKFDIQ
jgi:LemA protein